VHGLLAAAFATVTTSGSRTALLSEWPAATLSCRITTRPVAVALLLGVAARPAASLTGSAAPRRRPERLAGLSRLLTAAVSLTVSILVEPALGLAHREIGSFALRHLSLGTWQRRTNQRPMHGAFVFERLLWLSLVVHLWQLG